MLVNSIFSFSTMFSKVFFLRVGNSLDCVVKDLTLTSLKFCHWVEIERNETKGN